MDGRSCLTAPANSGHMFFVASIISAIAKHVRRQDAHCWLFGQGGVQVQSDSLRVCSVQTALIECVYMDDMWPRRPFLSFHPP